MSRPTTLHIAQAARGDGKHAITLTLERPGQPRHTAKADIAQALAKLPS